MITASELRIGNLISRQSCIQRVTEIWENNFSAQPLNADSVKENVYDEHGIILTEEWLLKFAFIDCHGEFRKDEELILHWYSTRECYCVYLKSTTAQIAEIKYVHQLQNLYFALEGEELVLQQTHSESR